MSRMLEFDSQRQGGWQWCWLIIGVLWIQQGVWLHDLGGMYKLPRVESHWKCPNPLVVMCGRDIKEIISLVHTNK